MPTLDFAKFDAVPWKVEYHEWDEDIDERPTGWSWKTDQAKWSTDLLGWEGRTKLTKVVDDVPITLEIEWYMVPPDDVEDMTATLSPPDLKTIDKGEIVDDFADPEQLQYLAHEQLFEQDLPAIDEEPVYDRRNDRFW